MARNYFGIEHGLRIYQDNSDTFLEVLFGSGAPGGDAGVQDAAPIGSMYLRSSDGATYKKIANNGNAQDWKTTNSPTFGNWRNEVVRAATNDTLTAGATDPTSWSDNDGGLDYTAFQVGEFVISDADGTPTLFRVASIANPNITLEAVVDPLTDNDMLIVRNYLPDPSGQEAQAIVLYPGGALVKIADFNWELATGINISGGYTAANGTVSSADTVESAIEKLDGNQQDLITLSGVAQGSVDLGTFTGSIIPDSSTIKQALQSLETEIEANHIKTKNTGVTTAITQDEVLVDSYEQVKWLVEIQDETTPTGKVAVEVHAIHNGHAGADATLTDYNVFSKLKVGTAPSYTIDVDVNGVGAAQTMRLRVSASSAATVRAARIANNPV